MFFPLSQWHILDKQQRYCKLSVLKAYSNANYRLNYRL